MFKFETRITEDTFTEWAEKKLGEVDAFHYQLMTLLANTFLEEVDPFVPVVSGSLLESGHKFWVFTDALTALDLKITWTGIANEDDDEYAYFGNYDYEDYAYRVHTLGEHHKKGTPASSSNWINVGLTYFDSASVNAILEEEFLAWLLSGVMRSYDVRFKS